jgi:multicomponent Na+:H+ antiporter subunit E
LAPRLIAGLTLLWWVLTDNAGWELGVPAVGAATVTALLLAPPPSPWSLWGLFRFILYFLKESWIGGLDVARRAFRAEPPLQPTWVHYPSRLPPGAAQILFITTITLLPGTLSAELQDTGVLVHALDPAMVNGLTELEQRVAGLFALSLS